MSDQARALLAQASCVLLDFDGPVCSVFAGWPAHEVADSLRARLHDEGHPLSDLGLTSPDPLEVLRNAFAQSPAGGARCEELLAGAELICAESAKPTPGAHELIASLNARGVPIAIVSNNSAACIQRYLSLHGLLDHIAYVSARDPRDPRLMKPNPRSVVLALDALAQPAESAVMIGDTVSDMVAAKQALVPGVFLRKRPEKIESTEAVDHAVIFTMQALEGSREPPAPWGPFGITC